MTINDVLYLSSLDSYRFEPVRICRNLRRISFGAGRDALLVDLDPGISGADFNRTSDLSTFVLIARFEGASIAPVN
jgi:hypothetical protein